MQEHLIEGSPNELYEMAKATVIKEQSASVSLVQRRLRLGYSIVLSLMDKLQEEGVVTPLGPSGIRQLTSRYSRGRSIHSNMNPRLISMLDKFGGCEGGDPGSITTPTIWLFGVEPGWSKFDQKRIETPVNPTDDAYSIDIQLQWSYNRNAFKLLAVIAGIPLLQYRDFANEHQPFARGSKGYFKGNLYPYACNNLADWPQYAVQATSFTSKAEYQKWCVENRWPVVKSWVDEHQPELFVGVGNTFHRQFSLSVFGRSVKFECRVITVNGYTKKIYFCNLDGRKLVVIPHLSGGRNGLNSDEAIEKAGAIIAEFLKL